MRPRLAARHSVCSSPRSFALLTEYRLVSFPPLTKIFQFRGCSLLSKLFGNPGFNARVRLPRAFRNLLRPSSLFEPNHPLSGSSNYSLFIQQTCFLLPIFLLPHGFMKTNRFRSSFCPPFDFQTPSATKELAPETSFLFHNETVTFRCSNSRMDSAGFPQPPRTSRCARNAFFRSRVFLNPRPRACKARALPLRHEPSALIFLFSFPCFSRLRKRARRAQLLWWKFFRFSFKPLKGHLAPQKIFVRKFFLWR